MTQAEREGEPNAVQGYHRDKGGRIQRLYAVFELVYTGVDFGAALCFLVGSILFLYPDLMTPATWLIIVGSVLFAAKPTLRLVREIRLVAMGEPGKVAERVRD